ncbi:MAG: hypothetical protein ABSF23_18480 [Terracidiphilus sp.]|jgi:RNA polymerase subunit RPABC4/transcription elongation factor Spt4
MFCAHCGRILPAGAVTCAVCDPSPATIPQNPPSLQKGPELLRTTAKTFLGLGILNILVGIVLVAMGWIPGILSIVLGIVELINSHTFWSTPPRSTYCPTYLSVLEMVNFITGGSLWGLVFGYMNYKRLRSPEVKAYLAAVEQGVFVPQVAQARALPDRFKQCPRCAETIQLNALLCRFCGQQFSETEVAAAVAQATQEHGARVEATTAAMKQAGEAIRQQMQLNRLRSRIMWRLVPGLILACWGALVTVAMVAMFFSTPDPGSAREQQRIAAVCCGTILGLAPLGFGVLLLFAARSAKRALALANANQPGELAQPGSGA